MKVLLVKPPSDMHVVLPPIGLGYLASSLKKSDASFEVSIVDCLKQGYGVVRFRQYLERAKPDVVGFTAFTMEIASALKCAAAVKDYNPGIITIVGGAHVSAAPQEVLGNRNIDFIFRGEAEESLPLFLKRLGTNDFHGIGGLGYKENNAFRFNEIKLAEDLDALVFPDYELMKFREYPRMYFTKRFPAAPILTSRGCPYDCTFCSAHKISGRKWRFRSPENIIAEIKMLYGKYGIREISIWDDNFALDRDRALKFCRLLKEADLDLIWWCPNGVSLHTVDEELLTAMKDSGCYAVAFGVESGSEKVLEDMKKKLSLEKLKDTVSLAHRMGFRTQGFFIIGYPVEEEGDILKTIRLSKELPFSRASFCLFQPLVGSEIYERLMAAKQLPPDLDSKNCEYSKPSVPTSGVADLRRLKRWQRKAIAEFYLRPGIFLRFLRENMSFDQLRELTVMVRKYIFSR